MAPFMLFLKANWKWLTIGFVSIVLIAGIYFGIKIGLQKFETSIRNEERLVLKTEQLETVIEENKRNQEMIDKLNDTIIKITSNADNNKEKIIERHTSVEKFIEDNKSAAQNEEVSPTIKETIRRLKDEEDTNNK